MSTFFTIGHSTRPLAAFAELLQAAKVQLVADVRTVPRSRTNPQYNQDSLPPALEAFDISYRHFPALGGLRPKARSVPPGTNAFWRHASFHNYADYAMSDVFQAGLAEFRGFGATQCCAIMCAETLWWRCHRRIITDYLINAGETVFHVLGPGQIEPASLTPEARPAPASNALVYPAAIADLFD
jgi:uncharacterized protein (DUF488 family)